MVHSSQQEKCIAAQTNAVEYIVSIESRLSSHLLIIDRLKVSSISIW